MIVVKLTGGLGNQMFQYAAGRVASLKNRTSLKLDISALQKKNWANRHYCLNNFNINENFYDFPFPPFWLKKLARPLYDKEFINIPNNSYLNGQWQNERYFKDMKGQILIDFALKNALSKNAEKILNKINSVSSVSIHIRRADYLSEKMAKVYRVCPMSYYEKAANLIEKKYPNAFFFVFSDDIAWAKENFTFAKDTFFVSGRGIKDEEELILMSKCRHNIIANSSFSWWGAWLNNNPGKIVITPKRWFVNPENELPGLVCPTWVKI